MRLILLLCREMYSTVPIPVCYLIKITSQSCSWQESISNHFWICIFLPTKSVADFVSMGLVLQLAAVLQVSCLWLVNLYPRSSVIGPPLCKHFSDWSTSIQARFILVQLYPSTSLIGPSLSKHFSDWSTSIQALLWLVHLYSSSSLIGPPRSKHFSDWSTSTQALFCLVHFYPSSSLIGPPQSKHFSN